MQQIIDAQGVKLSAQGQSQDVIDKAADVTAKYGAVIAAVFTAIGSLIFGCIVALVGAAILKKEPTLRDIEERNAASATDDHVDPTV